MKNTTFKDKLRDALNIEFVDTNILFKDTIRVFCEVYKELGYEPDITLTGWEHRLTLRKGCTEQTGVLTWSFSGKYVTIRGGGYVNDKIETDDPEVVKRTLIDWVSRRLICF